MAGVKIMKNGAEYQVISGQSEVHLIDDSENAFKWEDMLPVQTQDSVASGADQDFKIALSNASPTVVVNS